MPRAPSEAAAPAYPIVVTRSWTRSVESSSPRTTRLDRNGMARATAVPPRRRSSWSDRLGNPSGKGPRVGSGVSFDGALGRRGSRDAATGAAPFLEVDRLEEGTSHLRRPRHHVIRLAGYQHQRDPIWVGDTFPTAPVQAEAASVPLVVALGGLPARGHQSTTTFTVSGAIAATESTPSPPASLMTIHRSRGAAIPAASTRAMNPERSRSGYSGRARRRRRRRRGRRGGGGDRRVDR
jgi:hypothetical protein